MNQIVKSFVVVSAILSAGMASAQNVAGKWNGRLSVTTPPMPESMPAEQKQKVLGQIQQVKQMKFLLTMNVNKTFSLQVSGGPMPKAETGTGKWTRKGSVLTLKTEKQNGKATPSDRPIELQVSKDGKKMVAMLGEGKGKASLVFVR